MKDLKKIIKFLFKVGFNKRIFMQNLNDLIMPPDIEEVFKSQFPGLSGFYKIVFGDTDSFPENCEDDYYCKRYEYYNKYEKIYYFDNYDSFMLIAFDYNFYLLLNHLQVLAPIEKLFRSWHAKIFK